MTDELYRFANLLSANIKKKTDEVNPFEADDLEMRRDLMNRQSVMLEIRQAIDETLKEMRGV